MEFTLSGNPLKTLARSITCLARVGHELTIQASPSQLSFHTLNSSRSAYQLITFNLDFFDIYTVPSSQVQCSMFLKAVCAILRTPIGNIDNLKVLLADPDASKILWTLECFNGIRKSYWITCNIEPDIQQLSLDRRRYTSSFVVRPHDLNRLLANFQSSLQEITIIATERSVLPSDAANEIGGKAVELRSYIDPTKDSDASLHTQLWIDPAEEFVQYTHSGDPVDVTFGVKELKAFLSFCEGCEVDIHIYFEKAGEPVLLAPKFGLDNGSASDFDSTLVLATILVSQLHEGDPPGLQPATPMHGQAGQHTASGAQQERSRATTSSDNPSNHTKIWSDLSGSGARSGSGSHGRQVLDERNLNVGVEREIGRISTIQISRAVPAGGNVQAVRIDHSQPIPSQRHPSNWVEADDGDDDDGNELCVQSTPPYFEEE